MNESPNDYHISFFKPTTPQAKSNRNMVIWLVSVWFVAIFGFHIVLKLIEKPTPEPIYTEFNKAWGNLENNTAAQKDFQVIGQASLSVLGKIFVSADEKSVLQNALSHSAYWLTADSLKSSLIKEIESFLVIKDEAVDINDAQYQSQKKALIKRLCPVIGLSNLDVRKELIAIELTSSNINAFTVETQSRLPDIMQKYLVHNQSVLTDMKFLGFPFHYFYTAVFLLILFVGLCLGYCVRTDMLNAKFNNID